MAARILSLATFGLFVTACGPTDFNHCFDSEPRPLLVIIDPSLTLPESFTYTCEGNAGWGDGACDAAPVPTAVIDGDLNIFLRKEGWFGWWPMIEATRDHGARLCGVRYTDVGNEEPSCDNPACATSGTVTLSRFPDAASTEPLGVIVDVDFANRAHLRAEFAVWEVR
jgi:hypothetical protein